MTLRVLFAALLAGVAVLTSGPAATAQTYYWDAGSPGTAPATGGAGTWNTSLQNWILNDPTGGTPTAYPAGTQATAIAVFGGTSGAVSVGAPVRANQLQFTATGYTFTSSGAGNTISFAGTSPSIVAGTGTVTRFGSTATIASPVLTLSAGSRLTISGGGEVILASALGGTPTTINVTGGSILTIGDRTTGVGPTSTQIGTIPSGNAISLVGSTLQLASSSAQVGTNLFTAAQLPSITFSGNSTITGINTSSTPSLYSPNLNETALISSGGTLNIVPGTLNASNGRTNNRYTFGATTLNGDTTFVTQNMATFASNLTLGALKDNGFATTFYGGGSATVLPGSGIRLETSRVAAGDQTGSWVIGNPEGTQGVVVSLGLASPSDQALTTGHVTVNPYGQLLFSTPPAPTFGSASQTLTLNGIGAQVANESEGSSGALRFGLTPPGPTTYTFNGNVTVGTLAPVTVVNVLNAGTTLAVGGAYTANGALRKDGAGILALTGSGSGGPGGTTITAGAVAVAAASALGTGNLTLAQTVTSSTALTLNNAAQTVGNLSSQFAATTGTVSQVITLNGTALTVNQSANTTYGTGAVPTLTSTITGTGRVILGASSTGTLTLSGNNTYSGGTTINGGTLVASGQVAPNSATGSGPVGVSGSSAVLASGTTGRVAGTVTAGGGGTVAPGGVGTVGTLAVGGSVILQNTGRLAVDVGAGTTADRLTLDNGSSVFDVLAGSILAVNATGGVTTPAGPYTLVTLPNGANIRRDGSPTADGDILGQFVQGGGSGGGGPVTIQPAGFALQPGDTFTLRRVGDSVVLNHTPVPEPTTVGLVAAAGLALAGLARRRRPQPI